MATGPEARSFSIRKPSTFADAGRSNGGRRPSPTTRGGSSATTPCPPARGAHGNGRAGLTRVRRMPAGPADPGRLPPLLQRFGAVAALVTGSKLSVVDRFLYGSCRATGEFIHDDVSDPFHPLKVSSLRLG